MRRLLPMVTAGIAALVLAGATSAASDREQVYADGQVYTMIGATLHATSSPGQLSAPPLYLIGYPTAQASGSLLLPSGYSPQCDPCNHSPFHYHDHVVTGEPGSGTNGTAGDYRAPWRIVVMAYTPAYYNSPDFVPITSDAQIPAYENATNPRRLVQVNAGGPGDQYQLWTNMILICPIIGQNS